MSANSGRPRGNRQQSHAPVIEGLEPRAYFSGGAPNLLVTVPGPIPASARSGEKIHDRIAVNVSNSAGSTSGPYTITLFASSDTVLTEDDSQIAQITKSLRLGFEKNKNVVVPVSLLPVNLNGVYYILARVSGAQATVVGSSNSTVAIAPSHTDLHGSIVSVPTTARLGKKVGITMTLFNDGNVAAKGTLAIAFSESASMSGINPVTLGTVSKRINLKANSSKTLRLNVPLPLGIPSGNQFIVATLLPPVSFNDSNVNDKLSVSMSPVSLR